MEPNEPLRDLLAKQQSLRADTKQRQGAVENSSPIPRPSSGEKFIKGPIPYEWLRRALKSGGKSGHLAFAIWWMVGIRKANPVRLTAQILGNFCISTRAAHRLLDDFEQRGLVKVSRRRGRGPDVFVTNPENRGPNKPQDHLKPQA